MVRRNEVSGFAPCWIKCAASIACVLVFPSIVAALAVAAEVPWWALPPALIVTIYGLASLIDGRSPKPMSLMVDLVRGRAEVRSAEEPSEPAKQHTSE